MKTFRIPLRVVFYKEAGAWIAHCLEFDLCGDGATRPEALRALGEAITLQVKESVEHKNPKNLFSPAPSDIQRKFFAGRDTAKGELEFGLQSVDAIEFEEPEYREYSDDDLVTA